MWKNDNSIFISLLLPALKSFALAFIFPLLFSNHFMWDRKVSFYHSPSNSSLAGRMGGACSCWLMEEHMHIIDTVGSAEGPQALY